MKIDRFTFPRFELPKKKREYRDRHQLWAWQVRNFIMANPRFEQLPIKSLLAGILLSLHGDAEVICHHITADTYGNVEELLAAIGNLTCGGTIQEQDPRLVNAFITSKACSTMWNPKIFLGEWEEDEDGFTFPRFELPKKKREYRDRHQLWAWQVRNFIMANPRFEQLPIKSLLAGILLSLHGDAEVICHHITADTYGNVEELLAAIGNLTCGGTIQEQDPRSSRNDKVSTGSHQSR